MKRSRWLLIFAVLGALVAAVAVLVAPAGGASRARPKSKVICRSSSIPTRPRAHVTAQAAVSGDQDTDHDKAGTRETHVYTLCVKQRSGRNGANGAPGATGPAGPPGAAGAPGANAPALSVNVARTAVPFTTDAMGKPSYMADGGNVVPLAQVGPIHIDGLCRHTTAGPGGSERGIHYPDPVLGGTTSRNAANGESEAQVIVWTETGSLSFKGQVGHRENVPAGPPDYSPAGEPTGTPSGKPTSATGYDPVKGEGQHLFVASSNETVDEDRGTDPASDNPSTDVANGTAKQLPEYPNMQFGSGMIGTSDGHAAWAEMLAGMDVMGVYGECVFAGSIRTLS